MRRVPIALAGLLLGFLAGLVALAILLIREAMLLPPQTSLDVLGFAAWAGGAFTQGAAPMLWRGALALCLAPLLVVVLAGEAARLRSVLWYAGATGAITAAVPTLVRAILDMAPAVAPSGEGRLTLLLFLAGVAAGGTYWLVAGRTATAG